MYGWLLVQEKQLDEAIGVLARGVSAAPDDPHLRKLQPSSEPEETSYEGVRRTMVSVWNGAASSSHRSSHRTPSDESKRPKAIRTWLLRIQQIGRYTCKRRLASGGMGEVYSRFRGRCKLFKTSGN